VVLLAIGIMSLISIMFIMGSVVPDGEDAVEPFAVFLGIPLYALGANVCYTLGCIQELRLRKTDPENSRKWGKRMFWRGLIFSSLLTSFPFWWGLFYFIKHKN
jgi:hypothetical protein